MPERINQKVMLATWNWREPGAAAGQDGEVALRRQAVVQSLVMVGVAALLYFVFHHTFFVPIILALAAIIMILGMVYPPAYRPIHRFGRTLGTVVGKGLTYLLLVPFFFLFFTPVALILRAQGRDPLHRGFRDPQWTYWIRRNGKDRIDNIDKQFLREDKEARGEMRAVGPDTDRQAVDGS